MLRATTIVACRKEGKGAVGGDGQVTLGGNTIIKHSANKIRRLYKDRVIVGFAGSVADAFTLAERFEKKLEEVSGNLRRASVELAADWRNDKVLRKLDALMIALDKESMLVISGGGEVIEPDDDFIAIGSGGSFALAAGKALINNTQMTAREICEESLRIASQICVYTNENINIVELSEEL